MFAWTRRPARRTSPAARPTLRFRPSIDGLEDRLQLSTLPSLGAAAQYTVLGVNKGTVCVNKSTVDGALGLSPQEKTNFDHAVVTGGFYADPTATFDPNKVSVPGGTVRQAMDQAQADALAASSQYAALAPTQAFGKVTTSLTVTGTGGTNVVQMSALTYDKDVLTLAGGPADVFVINVSGDLKFNSSAVQLTGGVTADHVLFNAPTAGTDVQLSGSNRVWRGTVLAPARKVVDNGVSDFAGALIGKNVNVQGGDAVHGAPFAPPVTSAAPASLSGYVTSTSGLGIAGVTVTLTGTDYQGNPVSLTATTSNLDGEEGFYYFANLAPGTYTVTQGVDPALAYQAQAGMVNGGTDGTASGAVSIANIALGFGDQGVNYNFTDYVMT